ncbi:MAG: hypothetical protein NT099_02980 [Candidatus Saganbacteria bacterium]|nr:hypothetical protein [Candidatus Saganbacteria bacterium]
MTNQMEFDEKLFEAAENSASKIPFIRVYQWNLPSITYGYNQKIEALLDLGRYEGWQILKRPTGGGVVFHNAGEISFTVILPKGKLKVVGAIEQTALKIAAFLKEIGLNVQLEWVKHARQADFCTAFVSRHEITLDGKKLVGIAQRFGRCAILQQGTIFGIFPQIDPVKLKEYLYKKPETCD